MTAIPGVWEAPAGPLPYPGGRRLALRGGEAAVTAWSAPDLGPGTVLLGRLAYREPGFGAELLRAVLPHLGARRVLGPMDGSTWGAYRVAIPEGDSGAPGFLGEPSGRDFPVWSAAGFEPSVYYQSRWTALPVRRSGSEALAARGAREGVLVREAAPSPETARRLFDFSCRAFAGNPFFRPLAFEHFVGLQGRGVGSDPLVMTAESAAGRLLAFALAYPDAEPGRLILKTLAAAPEARALGLGARLADELHRAACERGYRTMVHALMREDNASLRLSLRYESRLLRRYALLAWRRE